jgi:hypothetical protein
VGVGQEDSEGVGGRGQEDEDSDGVGQEEHEDLEGSGQEHHGGFTDYEGGEGDGSATGSGSIHRWFKRRHMATPPVAPHTDNRVLIIPCGDG